MSPFGEMKVGIPYAYYHDVHPLVAYVIGCVGNILIIPLVYFFLDRLNKQMMRIRSYKRMSVKIARIAKKRTGEVVKKYGFWGLIIFVGIPLPVTGAYIGTIAAWMFKMDRRRAFASITLGVLMSGILISLAAHTGGNLMAKF